MTKRKNKRIAFFIFSLGAGGAEKMAVSLMHYWAKKGHDISCFTFDDETSDFYSLPDGIHYHPLNIATSSNTSIGKLIGRGKQIFKLRKVIKNHKPDVVVSFVFVTNILLILATRGLNTKTIVSERNDPSRQSEGQAWDFLRKKTYNWAHWVTVNSQNGFDTLQAYVASSKLMLTLNRLTSPDPLYILDYAEKEDVILSVARLTKQKDHATLLRAFSLVQAKHPNWKLMLAGDGPLRAALEALAKSLSIENKVTFKGQIENPYNEYARAKLYVMSSLHEGTPNALLEAMSCGVTPIISDSVYGALPYIENSEQIFNTADVRDLTNKITAFIENEGRIKAAAKQAIRAVKPLQSDDIFKSWDMLL
jgi:glycosyltransferase involved in cell wall biosynthesis